MTYAGIFQGICNILRTHVLKRFSFRNRPLLKLREGELPDDGWAEDCDFKSLRQAEGARWERLANCCAS